MTMRWPKPLGDEADAPGYEALPDLADGRNDAVRQEEDDQDERYRHR